MRPPFSQRLGDIEHGLNPLAAALAERRDQGEPVLDLTQSNPTTAGFDYPENEIREALSGRASLEYHPSPRGLRSAREAVSGYYAARGERRAADDFVLTTSTSEAYSFLLKLLCNPGDEVCVPAPSYPLLEYLADLECVGLKTYPLAYGGAASATPRWRIDFEALKGVLTDKTRAVIVVNPNNPTGNLLSPEEVTRCVALARERNLALIVDEVFSDYCLDSVKYTPVDSDGGLVFTLNGFSKVLGLPQLKLGWIHVGGASDLKDEALNLLDIIADTFLSVNTPIQAACPALLSLREGIQGQIQKRLRRNLQRLSELAAGRAEFTVLPLEGGWYVVLRMHTVEAEEKVVLSLLRDASVYTHPGAFFGFDGGRHVVLSLLTPEADFAEGCERIVHYASHRML